VSAADWRPKLPPKTVKLLEHQRESISPEYREQINHYFRVIGERGRTKSK
jgi:hypothetical protein